MRDHDEHSRSFSLPDTMSPLCAAGPLLVIQVSLMQSDKEKDLLNGKRVKIVDEDFMRRLSESVFTSHIQFAPAVSRRAWDAFIQAALKKETHLLAEAAQLAEEGVSKSLADLCSSLEKVSPAAAVELLIGERPGKLGQYRVPKGAETISLSRGAWLIGVFGSGDEASSYEAQKTFNKYVRWVTAHLIQLHITSLAEPDETEREIAYNYNRLVINRLVEPETRMMWVTDEITREIGKWVDTNAELPKLSGVFDSNISHRIGENSAKAQTILRAALTNKSQIREPFSTILLDDLPEALVDSLTAKARPLTESNVERALKSEDPITTPFVRIENYTWVLGRSAWLMQRDDPLFRLAMQASPRGKEGQVFEDVTASLLRKWGPHDLTWSSSVDLVSPATSNTEEPDDLDVFGFSSGTAFIGECKANRLSDNISSVGASFETVVLDKAVEQIETRVEHWNAGWRPENGVQTSAGEVTGFGVTFSSYGGMLWTSKKLLRDGQPVRHTVLPLYSLILAVSIIDSPQRLKRYFDYRLETFLKGATNSDELEFMLGFIREENDPLPAIPEGTNVVFRQYELSETGVWIDPRKYPNEDNWKNQFVCEFWEHTKPVTPS